MAKLLAIDGRIDGKRLIGSQQRIPFEAFRLFIEFVGVACFERYYRFENFQRRTAAEIRLIEHSLVARKRHHTRPGRYVAGAQLSQFFSQYVFKTLKRLGNELHFLFHLYILLKS